MPRPTQTPLPNKHGCLPPSGFKVPAESGIPQVAIGNEGKSSYEAAFLVETDKLLETFSTTVASIATLKAWFAYRLRAHAIKDSFLKQDTLLDVQLKLPSWQTAWSLVRKKGEIWTKQYQTRGLTINPWELQPNISAEGLFAQVVVVLAFHITANSDTETPASGGFKWHQYYYEDNGRYFLLHRFMSYLNVVFASNRSVSFYEPSDVDKRRLWVGSCGYQIHRAAKAYMRETSWDPDTMLSKALQSGVIEPSALQINKAVTFIFSGRRKRQVFKKDVKAIRQNARANLSLTLKELFGVTKVVVRAVQDDKLIRSRTDLWTSIESSDSPTFWMYHESDGHTTAAPVTPKRTSQRDYSIHAILRLEDMVDKLDSQDQARSARSRFSLIRENHRHSAEFVKELAESFASLEKATTERWLKLLNCKCMCEHAASDSTQFYKLRQLIGELDDAQQVHARQYFTLVDTNNPLASVAAENLVKLFTPDEIELEEVSKLMVIFNEINRDTMERAAAVAQG